MSRSLNPALPFQYSPLHTTSAPLSCSQSRRGVIGRRSEGLTSLDVAAPPFRAPFPPIPNSFLSEAFLELSQRRFILSTEGGILLPQDTAELVLIWAVSPRIRHPFTALSRGYASSQVWQVCRRERVQSASPAVNDVQGSPAPSRAGSAPKSPANQPMPRDYCGAHHY
jgi:hypothetical protein